jgi:hypothetical protein
MRNFFRLVIPSLLLILVALTQPWRTSAGTDWPAIVPEELALKDNPASPGSLAMMLYREELVNSTDSSENYYYRMKIFTEAGKKYADIEIPFLKGAGDVKDVRARTIHPDGKVIDFSGQILDKLIVKDRDLKIQAKTFTLPDVVPGSIIEYRYKIQRDPGFYYNITWQIQNELYTKRAHFVFKPYVGEGAWPLLIRSIRLDKNVIPQKQKDGSYSLDVNDIQGVPEEDFMLPEDELQGHVEFVYTQEDHPPDAREYWNKAAKTMADSEEKFIGKRAAIRQVVDQTVSPSDSPETKLRKLYARAQQIRNWQAEQEKSSQESKREKLKDNSNSEDVLKRGYGSGLDINLFFAALAQAAGFDSSMVWLTPRNKGVFHMDMQDKKELGADIVWVHAGDKDYYLDPAAPLCPFDILPWYETTVNSMRTTKQGAIFAQTPATPSSSSRTERHVQLTLEPDGSLSGTLLVRYTGQRALSRRDQARDEDETGRNKIITDEVKDWLPSNAKFDLAEITGWDKSDVPLEAKGKLNLPGMGEMVGRRLLLPLGLYEAGHPQLFDTAARKQDIYFHFPYEEVDDIIIQLPSGLRAETLPAPQVIDPGGLLHYEIAAKQENDSLHLQRRLVVGGILYPVNVYAGVRHFFSTAKSDDEQQVILQAAAASTGRN